MSQAAPSLVRLASDSYATDCNSDDAHILSRYAASPPPRSPRRQTGPRLPDSSSADSSNTFGGHDRDDARINDNDDDDDDDDDADHRSISNNSYDDFRNKRRCASTQPCCQHLDTHTAPDWNSTCSSSGLALTSRSPRPTLSSSPGTSQQNSPASTQTYEPFDTSSPIFGAFGHHSQLLTPVTRTTFLSDSSDLSGPEDEKTSSPHVAKGNSTVSEPLTSKSPSRAASPPFIMEGPMLTASTSAMSPVPRNPSLDIAMSAMSSHGNSSNLSPNLSPPNSEIAHLIQAAGSPDAVIQYLLKEKQSQSQQNAQLWRLVDKQRAMILGLNKDLEAALKDKERYRKKLKEFMTKSMAPRPTTQPTQSAVANESRSVQPRHDDHQAAIHPDSPLLESDGQKESPVHITMAPCPITPPADHPQQSPVARVAQVLAPAPAQVESNSHEHAVSNHLEAGDRAQDETGKQKSQDKLQDVSMNASLPSSPTLPSEPPSIPPPSLPPGSDPESPPGEKKTASRSMTSPRKGPPAPLQLSNPRAKSPPPPPAAGQGSDSEPDSDDVLNVKKTGTNHDLNANQVQDGAKSERGIPQQQSPQQPDNITTPASAHEQRPATSVKAAPDQGPEAATASLSAILNNNPRQMLAPPLLSPGLPKSPRPIKALGQSPPGSPGFHMPLSPRPPRQPIPLPSHSPLATSITASPEPIQSQPSSAKPSPKNYVHDTEPQSPTNDVPSPRERTQIYRELASDQHPDLLLPPNALPSIHVKVASSRMKPSRASLLSLNQLEEDPVFTLAIISRSDGGELWRVEKDTSSLSKLDQRMKQCPTFTAKTPEKSLFSGHSPARLDARRRALDDYMFELLNTLLDEDTALELCKYLSTNTLPPNADETGAAAKLTADAGTHKTRVDGRSIRTGYLTKKGKNFGGWKVRFFVSDGPNLKYYETPGGSHLGTIKLQGAQIGKQSQSSDNQSPTFSGTGEEFDNQYRHAFLILEPKKKDSTSHVKHVLCAENDRERDSWVDALLQWIDYRETDDDAQSSKTGPHDKQNAELPAGTKLKKSALPRAASQYVGDRDPLIGVRYDTTNAGDAPQHGSSVLPRSKTGLDQPSLQSPTFGIDAPPLTPMSMSQPKAISGPKDLQLISDAAAWGNKPGPPQPSAEDKKQRKRSFFGFGPKARSSSDGPDSLPVSESGALSMAPQTSANHGGHVFGATLSEAVQFHPPRDADILLPSVVYRCIQYLEAKNALNEEGIFRLSGSNIVIKQIRERFNNQSDINLVNDEHYYDIHAVASLLKLYLRELPSTILTRDLHIEFLNTTEIAARDEKVATMALLIQRLPEANLTLLKYLISFLIRIINNADINKMTVRNVGIVFSPTLNIPAPVFAAFLQNYEGIFGINPEDYKISVAAKEVSSDGRTTRDGSTSASPQRQARMEAVKTPSRSTPTPPPAAGRVHESPRLPQASRLAYESNRGGQGATGSGPRRSTFEFNLGPDQTGAVAGGSRPMTMHDKTIRPMLSGSRSSTNLVVNEPRGKKRRESSIYVVGATSTAGHS